MPTPSHEVLRRIRSKLHFAAALAIKNNIDVSAEIIKIFGLQESAESKNIIERNRLSMRDKLVLETIYESIAPVSINEMLEVFKGNRDTRCSKSTITASVKILKALELIKYTVEDMKVGYSRT
jgi:hypothetical protein